MKGKRVQISYGRATVKEESSPDATGLHWEGGEFRRYLSQNTTHTEITHGYERWPGDASFCGEEMRMPVLRFGQVFLCENRKEI